MITLIDNEPVSFQGGTMSDEEFTGTDEFKEITQALQTLVKHCNSFIVSGYVKNDHTAFVYNHAAGQESSGEGSHLYEVVKKARGEKAAREALRGTDLATHITNMLVDAKKQHGVDADAVLHTVQKGQVVMSAMNDMDSDEKQELMDALKGSNSPEEALEIMKARINGLNEATEHHDEIHERFQDLTDAFIRTDKKEDVDIKKLERTIKLATGVKTSAFKMSDPDCLPALAYSLSKNLKSTTLVGHIKMGEDGEIIDNQAEIHFQDGLKKISDKNKLEPAKMQVALAGSLCVGVFKTLKRKYGLPDGFFEEYMKMEKL